MVFLQEDLVFTIGLSDALEALGRLTAMPFDVVIANDAIIKKTNRKKMVSIIGTISIRAFLG
jgi:hypothetical protein